MTTLTLYDSLSRSLRAFAPIDPAKGVRVYSCGPTVYNYAHVGNLRAYVFTDTLSRVLTWKGHDLTHVINITDVGHLTSDADAGDDKMERAAAAQGRSIWQIATHYTDAFKRDVARLAIVEPTLWSVATEHVPQCWRLHMVGEPAMAPRVRPSRHAHARIDHWAQATPFILDIFARGEPPPPVSSPTPEKIDVQS